MQPSEDHIQDRIGSAIFRLAELGQRVDAAADSPKAAGKLLGEVRKLATELERALAELRVMATRYLELQHQATAACRRGERIFEATPVPCLLVDQAGGAVIDANPAAARLLNVSHRHLVGRSFPLFLNGDRDQFVNRLGHLGPEAESTVTSIRPRERSAVDVTMMAWRDSAEAVFVMIVPTAGAFAGQLSVAVPADNDAGA